MASPAMPPMPGDASAQSAAPPDASTSMPAPATPAPGGQSASQGVIMVVKGMNMIGQSVPQAAGEIAQINDLMREVMKKIMASQPTGEPMAPPSMG